MGTGLQSLKFRLTTFLFRSGSRLVDLDWYRSHNLKSAFWRRLAFLHYILFGNGQQAKNHPLFCPEYFARQCRQLGLDIPRKPLKTYLRNPVYWQVDTHPLFNTVFYTQQIGQNLKQSPLLHYLNTGHQTYDPHPLFSREIYFESFPALKASTHHCPLAHYLKMGFRNIPKTHPLFQARYYAAQAGISVGEQYSEQDLLLHFLTSPNRSIAPHPLFFPDYFNKHCQWLKLDTPRIPLLSYLTDPAYWRVYPHPVFDTDYYLSQISSHLDQPPLLHYLNGGHRIYDPHVLFQRVTYLKSYPDLANQPDHCPLLHYLTRGYKDLPNTHPLFHAKYYAEKTGIPFVDDYPEQDVLLHFLTSSHAEISCHPAFSPEYFIGQCQQQKLTAPRRPLKTYLLNPTYWHINTHPLFDVQYYKRQIDREIQQPALLDFIEGGHLQGDPHPLFQREWYIKKFPRLAKEQKECALVHYLKTWAEYMPSTHPVFHWEYYAEQAGVTFSDEKYAEDALVHFVLSTSDSISCHPLFSIQHFRNQSASIPEGSAYNTIVNEYILNSENWHYSTHFLFNCHYYLSQNPDETSAIPPLVEYIAENFLSHNPHPLFDSQWYIGRNKILTKLQQQNKVPLTHFVLKGHKRGESPHPLFALQWYRLTYMNGEVSDKNPLIEFLESGEQQGNRPNPLYPFNWQSIIKEHYHCETLAEFSNAYPSKFPSVRNRISDAFSTGYITDKKILCDEKNYLILFTPRSGSSWLTELLNEASSLGKPTEWFNPDLIQSGMNGLTQQCRNIYEYSNAIQEQYRSPDGYFGAELTATHLSMLQELAPIESLFTNPAYVLHLRGNIVSQAISLFLATETGFFHAHSTTNQDKTPEYSEEKIIKWLREILKDELYFYKFINDRKLLFYISWYENIKNDYQTAVCNIVAHITGIPSLHIANDSFIHKPISTSINQYYEDRFRQECPDFVEQIENQRPYRYSTEQSETHSPIMPFYSPEVSLI